MKIYLQILILLMGFNSLNAQQLAVVDSVYIDTDGEITDFGTDDFGNIYYIKNSSELNKYDLKTGKIRSFSNRNILEGLNTQNVLQITLKSGFFNLLILDNMLNPIQDPIDFSSHQEFMPSLIAVVDTNYLWAYDPVQERLILWNYRTNKINKQSVILNDEDASAYYSNLFYSGNKIYLAGRSKILKFDEFSNLEKVIQTDDFDEIQMYNGHIFYSKDNKIYQLDQRTEIAEPLDIGIEFDNFSINKEFLFVLKDKVVYLYNSQNFF